MPLTPAEVHNVAFKKPPIGKRGYDEEEVDAFLDVIEVELSRLIEENNDLRTQGGGSADSGHQGVTQGADPAELSAAREENEQLRTRIAELEKALTQGSDGASQQLVAVQQQLDQTQRELSETRQQLQQVQQRPDGQAALSSEDHVAQAVQMLALAQQTADNHLAQSKAEAERLLAEANANARSTVSEAQAQAEKHVGEAQARATQLDEESTTRATRTVRDAEQRAATITEQLEQRKDALERRLEQLRTFEREYRVRLKNYLESQLRDLDASGRAEPATQDATASSA